MNTALSVAPALDGGFSREQVEIIKRTIAPDLTDLELSFFLEVARVTGLNPLQRQVYAIKRRDFQSGIDKMTIQTGIDGYRAVAARTGQHAGTTDATYDSEDGDCPRWARVTVYRLVGVVKAEFTATARWAEYRQAKRDGAPMGLWGKMPYLMLAKCAEALALRKAFPAELSGVYTHEEMQQADTAPRVIEAEVEGRRPEPPPRRETPPAPEPVSADEFRAYFFARLAECYPADGEDAPAGLSDNDRHAAQLGLFGHESLSDLTDEDRIKIRRRLDVTSPAALKAACDKFVCPF